MRRARTWFAMAVVGAAAVPSLLAAFLGCNQLLDDGSDHQLADGGGGRGSGATDAATDAPPACATSPADNGACASPRSLCNGVCFNLTCDPGNCGACGHDCGGGSCGSGQCRPIALASDESGPGGLAVDDAGVYWIDNFSGEVRFISLDGGGLGTLATGQAGPVGIAVTPTHVYWTNNTDSTVQQCSKSTCTPSVFAQANRPAYLAASSSALYWANMGSYGSLQGASLSDGGPAIDTDAGGSGFNDVAVNGTTVYWGASAGVYGAPLAGGKPALAAADPSGVLALAVTATTLYWTNSMGTIHSQDIGATIPSQLHSGEQHPTGMAVDAKFVYWVDSDTGYVFRAPLDAKDETTTVAIASGQTSPYRIAVDEKFVYWTNGGNGGALVRLAK
jgi:hypothetical protein